MSDKYYDSNGRGHSDEDANFFGWCECGEPATDLCGLCGKPLCSKCIEPGICKTDRTKSGIMCRQCDPEDYSG